MANTLTMIGLVVAIVALGVVTYQTYLTRKSVTAALSSIELSMKTMQIEMLPKAGWAIEVRVKLQMWIDDLKKVTELSKTALAKQDAILMKRVCNAGIRSPQGLVRKYLYEHVPNWLSIILITGAQYYYDAKANQRYLWREEENTPWYDFIPSFVERCEDSLRGLNELLTFLDNMIPDVYLNSPASLKDRDFLGD